MASITFFLKEPNLDRPAPIIARVAVGGRKVKVYTGLRIEPRRWIQAAQQAQPQGYALAGQLNATRAAQRAQFEAYLFAALAGGFVPTPEQLRRVLDPAPVDAPAAPLPAAEELADDTPGEPAAPDLPAAYVARDLFLLACYTGLRYSDLVSLRPEHWQGNVLRLRTQKTRNVPLRPGAQALLQDLVAGELTFVSN